MQDDGRALVLGFIVGMILTTISMVICFTPFHSGLCLTHYTTIDGKYYYWGEDPNEQSNKSYYWQSVKVVPRTTFTPVEGEHNEDR